jgi:hypothetical protein
MSQSAIDNARLYAANAHHLRSRKLHMLVVVTCFSLIGGVLAIMGLAMPDSGAGAGFTVFGLLFVAIGVLFGLFMSAKLRDRMVVIRARVVRVIPATVDRGPNVDLAAVERLRLRPDGLCRPLRGFSSHRFGTSDEVYAELAARPHAWGDVRLLATNDGFVFCTLEAAWRAAHRG